MHSRLVSCLVSVSSLAFPGSFCDAQCPLSWSTPPGNGSAWLNDVFEQRDGQLLVAGNFTGEVVRWDGTNWLPIGVGPGGIGTAAIEMSNGDVVAARYWQVHPGVHDVWRWDGLTWTTCNGLFNHTVSALAELPTGGFVVGGMFTASFTFGANARGVARWDGTQWHSLGTGVDGSVYEVFVTQNGDVVAGGYFTIAGGQPARGVARWNGSTWDTLAGGSPLDVVASVIELGNGDLLAGGWFNSGAPAQSRLYRYDGTAWTAIGPAWPAWTAIRAVLVLPNGDLLAGVFGDTSSNQSGPSRSVQRWNGSAWSIVADLGQGDVSAMIARADGSIVVVGSLPTVDLQQAHDIAVLTSTCPATTAVSNQGCLPTSGASSLSVESLPWLGGTFAAASLGLPNNSFVAAITGLNTSNTPLQQLFPQALPGCSLTVQAEHLQFVAANAGRARATLPVPALAALIGLPVHHQHVVFELGATQNLVRVQSTDSVAVTIGAF